MSDDTTDNYQAGDETDDDLPDLEEVPWPAPVDSLRLEEVPEFAALTPMLQLAMREMVRERIHVLGSDKEDQTRRAQAVCRVLMGFAKEEDEEVKEILTLHDALQNADMLRTGDDEVDVTNSDVQHKVVRQVMNTKPGEVHVIGQWAKRKAPPMPADVPTPEAIANALAQFEADTGKKPENVIHLQPPQEQFHPATERVEAPPTDPSFTWESLSEEQRATFSEFLASCPPAPDSALQMQFMLTGPPGAGMTHTSEVIKRMIKEANDLPVPEQPKVAPSDP